MFVTPQQRMDNASQIPDALAVNDTNLENPACTTSPNILGDQFLDILRIELMQVENAVNRKLNGIVI